MHPFCGLLLFSLRALYAGVSPGPVGPDLGIESGTLDVTWIHGAPDCKSNVDPPIQVHRYNSGLIIMRQNKCVHYEAPFMYVIFGTKRALLLDTGATKSAAEFPLRQTVENLMLEHYGADARSRIELIVAHTHGHGDHMAGDTQFAEQAGTRLVSPDEAPTFFGIRSWPSTIGGVDLGGRILDVIPVPGHEGRDLAFYDRKTGLLFSGDSIYPGRIYIRNWKEFKSSIERLMRFLEGRPLTYVMGAHIEMSAEAGVDYPVGTIFQKNEHTLQLSPEALTLLASRLRMLERKPKKEVHPEFSIVTVF